MKEAYLKRMDSLPGMSGAKRDLVHQLLSQESPLTQEDIRTYVNQLIEMIRQYDDPRQKAIFLMHDLKDDLIIGNILGNKEQITSEDVESVLSPIRRAVVEELKRRLTEERDLGHINYSDWQFIQDAIQIRKEGKWQDHQFLRRTKDLSGRGSLLRKDKGYYVEEDLFYHRQAIKVLIALLPQEHILPLRGLGEMHPDTIAPEEENLSNLHNLIYGYESDPKDLAQPLSVIVDCMKGARVLEEYGLVLQDIKPDNLGYVTRYPEKNTSKTVGVLFDLEGIYLAGVDLHMRMSGEGDYMPPEFSSGERYTLESSEMVYQFGQCLLETLQALQLQLPIPVQKTLASLIHRMKYYDQFNERPLYGRIDLVEAIERLEGIIKVVRQGNRKGSQRFLRMKDQQPTIRP
ncbi:hypothetical protein EXS71_02255 [Candidatus Uhrbacteria bacterium]|nr:hypothetical protein [Candidatus Uhrbacteria bacterium]